MADRTHGSGLALRVSAGAAAVVVALGAVFVARAAAADDPTTGYRMATVTTGSVAQSLAFTGTVQRVDQQTATFRTSGTVAALSVTVGQTVRKGQQLAVLDTADLDDAVLQANAALARAEATLESDESGTSTGTSSNAGQGDALSAVPTVFTKASSSPPATDPSTTTKATAPGSPRGRSAAETVRAAQAAVAAAQAKVTAAERAATQALAASDTACADVLASPSTPSPTASTTATPTGTSTTGTADPAADATPDTEALARCLQSMRDAQSALHAVTAAQDAVSAAQEKVSTAQQAWAQALADAAKAATASPTTGQQGSTGQNGSSGTGSGQARTSTGSQSGAGLSTSRIASDRAAVTQAGIALDQATAARAQARLTAPAAGTVAAVGLTVGEAAGSNGITIVGTGGADVTVEVPVASIPKVRKGQSATVTPPGSVRPVEGVVDQVSLIPTDTSSPSGSSSAAAYAVVVSVTDPTPTLASGARAPVSITIGTATDVLTVPNSAITTSGTNSGVVTVVSKGVATRTRVTLGIVGATRTEVTQGLKAGDTVLLADASEAIPSSDQTSGGFGNRGMFGETGGGFTGGTFTGGGGPGVTRFGG